MRKFIVLAVGLLCAVSMFATTTTDLTITIQSKNGGGGSREVNVVIDDAYSPFAGTDCAAYSSSLSLTTDKGLYVKYSGTDYSVICAPDVAGLDMYVVTTAEAESEQEYTLTVEWGAPADNTETLYLHDKVTGSLTALSDAATYDFTVTSATDAGYTANSHSTLARFEIVRTAMLTLLYSGPNIESPKPAMGGAGRYIVGSSIEIYAQDRVAVGALTALKKERFSGWSDDNTENPRTLTMPASDLELTANYHQWVYKDIYDTIAVGGDVTIDDGYIDGTEVFTRGVKNATALKALVKASEIYNQTYSTAQSSTVLGAVDYYPLPDTVYRYNLRVFTPDEPVIYYVAPDGTHTAAYSLSHPERASSWADPYGDLNLACKHAGAMHATNGQVNVVLVKKGTYSLDPGDATTYVVTVPAAVAVYGGFNGDEMLSGVGSTADQVDALVAGRVLAGSDPWDFNYTTTIDGGGERRAVVAAANKFDDSPTIIDGLTITGGYYEAGSTAAGAHLAGNVILRNCVVTGNEEIHKSGAAGVYTVGAVTAMGDTVTPLIEGCNITGNTKTSAIVALNGAGVLMASHGLTIRNSRIAGNILNGNFSTAYGAGVYVTKDKLVLDGVTIDGNRANAATNAYGAGVYLAVGTLEMKGGTTLSNNVVNGATQAMGGGLYMVKGEADIENSVFNGNIAQGSSSKTYGGGAYIAAGEPNFHDNVVFKNNSLTPADGAAYGAGMYCVPEITLNDVTFGAVGEGNIINGVALAGGAGAYFYKATTLNNVIASYNEVITPTTAYGVGLYFYNAAVLNGCDASNNSIMATKGYGGGAYVRAGGVIATTGSMSGNTITAAQTTDDPDIATTVTAEGKGAGLYVAAGNATLSGMTFYDNSLVVTTEQTDGGDVDTKGSSTAHGAGLYLTAATHTLTNVACTNNSIASRAINMGGSETAAALGAGAYVAGEATYDACRFSDNNVTDAKAVSGVGLYAVTTATLLTQTFTGCEFSGNTFVPLHATSVGAPTALGGGAYLYPRYADNVMSLTGCTVSDNVLKAGNVADGTGTNRGAGVDYAAHADASVTIDKCVFSGNEFKVEDTTRDGVAVYGTAAVLDIYNSLFYNNLNGNYSLYVGANKILNNTIVNSTGGIYLNAGSASSLVANNIVWNTTYSRPFYGKTIADLPVKNNASTTAIPDGFSWDLDGNIENLNADNDEPDGPNFKDYSDPSSDDFLRLTNLSPMLEAGMDPSVAAVSSDMTGITRPQGTAYDMGAFEYFDPSTMVTLSLAIEAGQETYGSVVIKESGVEVTNPYEVVLASPANVLTAVAIPQPGYRFVQWDDDVTAAVRDVDMLCDITLTASFEAVKEELTICSSEQPYTYNIIRAGDPGTVLKSFTIDESAADVNSGIPEKVAEAKKVKQTYVPSFETTYSTTVKAVDGVTDSLVTVDITVNPVYEIDCGTVTINGTVYSPNGIYWTSGSVYYFDMPSTNNITGDFTTSTGCDSIYKLTVDVVKAAEKTSKGVPVITSWGAGTVTMLMTDVDIDQWSDLIVHLNGGSTDKTIANGQVINNGDNTITLAHSSGMGADQLYVEICDASKDPASEDYVVVRKYYDVPRIVTKSESFSISDSELDLYVVSGTATINAGSIVRDVTVGPEGILSVSKDMSANSLKIMSYRNTTGQVKVSSGQKLTLRGRSLTYSKRMNDNSNYYIMSLPYDIDFSSIRLQNGSAPSAKQIALFTYSGEERAHTFQNDAQAIAAGESGEALYKGAYRTIANLSDRTWVRQTSGTIPANTAFELGTNTAKYREFLFPVAIDRIEYTAADNATVNLSYYNYDEKTWDIHYGWNMVGLPSFSEKSAGSGRAFSHAGVEDYPVSVYNPSTKAWEQNLSSAVKLPPFTGFFIQAKQTGTAALTIAAAVPTVLAAPANDRSASDDINAILKLALYRDTVVESNEVETMYEDVEYENEEGDIIKEMVEVENTQVEDNIFFDNTILRINNSLTSGYDIGYDLEKLLTDSAVRPQFYSISSVGKMALSGIPASELVEPVRLGTRYAEAGEHIIALTEKPEYIEAVVLYDALTGTYTDLMQQAYHFTVNAATTEEGRFSLQMRIPQSGNAATDVEQTASVVTDSGIRVAAAGNTIILCGLDGNASVKMYDVTGRLVMAENDVENGVALNMPATGVYILSVKTATQNDAIKMILNK